jgi:hypothetical protein
MFNTFLPQILIIIGVIFTATGGFISFYRDNQYQIINTKLLEENSVLSNTINSNITGGNSYGDIMPLTIEDKYILYFENKGEYPLYDVNIIYWNPDSMLPKKDRTDSRATLEDLANRIHVQVGNIPVRGGINITQALSINEGETVKYNISISAKNGHFNEILRITKKDGKIFNSRKISTTTNGKEKPTTLLEELNPLVSLDN